MTSVRPILTRYRYYIVAALSTLMVFSATWVLVDMRWDDRYLPAVSSWLFFLSLFGWMCVVRRVGATEPVSRSTKRYAILVIFPLFIIASIGLVTLVLLPWFLAGVWTGVIGSVYLLATAALIGVVLSRVLPANKLRTKSRYIVIVLISLGLSTLWCALVIGMFFLPHVLGFPGGLIFAIVSLSIVFGSAGPLLFGTVVVSTMRRSYRNRVVMVIGVWIAITLGGWAVMTMLHDPSRSPYAHGGDIFWCENTQARRVSAINYHSWFSGTKYHSWWGIPIFSEPICGNQ